MYYFGSTSEYYRQFSCNLLQTNKNTQRLILPNIIQSDLIVAITGLLLSSSEIEAKFTTKTLQTPQTPQRVMETRHNVEMFNSVFNTAILDNVNSDREFNGLLQKYSHPVWLKLIEKVSVHFDCNKYISKIDQYYNSDKKKNINIAKDFTLDIVTTLFGLDRDEMEIEHLNDIFNNLFNIINSNQLFYLCEVHKGVRFYSG
ncbi:hypothetical protein AX774_g5680 [Zancudomyces culisetae]|uniref:Uncharacterized protein n=1 Tax=Zancudomyces culisetae TaxID=1213189 RepID=A0A1R1PIU1_ZANCU|nr:hypothetical protein AX774_g5680 [Zancudomyces culisetae]|eukprot:OMH80876.1 hypothetical protein AX774_g5680 [Zancudomyces culisetae]